MMETNKNLSLEYFIDNIRYDTTFKDVKREIEILQDLQVPGLSDGIMR